MPRPLSINTKLPQIVLSSHGVQRRMYAAAVLVIILVSSLLWSRDSNPSHLRLNKSTQLSLSQNMLHTLVGAIKMSSHNRFCPPIDRGLHYNRYKYLYPSVSPSENPPHRYFIAVNLYNNANVLSDMILQVLDFLQAVGPDNAFVSIYENGSKDTTKTILRLFSEILKEIGTPFRVHVSFTKKKVDMHRIEYMAEIRNRVLEKLYSDEGRDVTYRNGTTGKQHFDHVLFLNDVFFCASDLFELVHQQITQQSHMACGLDYDVDSSGTLGFYDTWVARDINGRAFQKKPLNSFVPHKESSERLAKDLPFEVYSCWNGVAVMDARPFLPPYNLRFRRVRTTKMEKQTGSSKKTMYKTCSASECQNICRDLHDAGFHRIMVVPSVKVTYEWDWYQDIKLLYPTVKDDKVVQEFSDAADEKVRFMEENGQFTRYVTCLPMENPGVRSPDGMPGEEYVAPNPKK